MLILCGAKSGVYFLRIQLCAIWLIYANMVASLAFKFHEFIEFMSVMRHSIFSCTGCCDMCDSGGCVPHF